MRGSALLVTPMRDAHTRGTWTAFLPAPFQANAFKPHRDAQTAI
jgi:hypothetical protein